MLATLLLTIKDVVVWLQQSLPSYTIARCKTRSSPMEVISLIWIMSLMPTGLPNKLAV